MLKRAYLPRCRADTKELGALAGLKELWLRSTGLAGAWLTQKIQLGGEKPFSFQLTWQENPICMCIGGPGCIKILHFSWETGRSEIYRVASVVLRRINSRAINMVAPSSSLVFCKVVND